MGKDGKVEAEIVLKLDKKIGDVPNDSDFRIRADVGARPQVRRARRGQQQDGVPRTATRCRTRRARRRRELDEVLKIFDEPTREAVAGEPARLRRRVRRPRRVASGARSRTLPPLIEHLQPVMRNLRRPGDRPRQLHRRARRHGARRRAGVEDNAALFTSMADTFEAIGRDPERAQGDDRQGPPTMDVAIESFRVQRPFLADLEGFGEDFSPATADLRDALPTLNRAVKTGIPVQQRAARPQRGARQDARPAARALLGARHAAGAPRAGATVDDAQPAAALLRPVRDGLQLPELLLHLPRRALLRARQHRLGAARAAQPPPRRTTASARWAPTSRPTARAPRARRSSRRTSPTPRRSRPTARRTARRASAAGSSATPSGLDPQYRANLNPRTPGAQGPTFSGAAQVPAGQTFTALPGDRPRTRPSPSPRRGDEVAPARAGAHADVRSRSRWSSSAAASTSASRSRSRSATTTRSRRSSSRPTTSRRPRPCGSRASTSGKVTEGRAAPARAATRS